MRSLARTYPTPFWLGVVFLALVVLFSFTPRARTVASSAPVDTPATTAPPHPYLVCGIDQTWDVNTGRCVPVDHTPLPCVASATFDAKAGFCLPTGPPPAPVAPEPSIRTPSPPRLPEPIFPPGIRRYRGRSGEVGDGSGPSQTGTGVQPGGGATSTEPGT